MRILENSQNFRYLYNKIPMWVLYCSMGENEQNLKEFFRTKYIYLFLT